ncbi:fungal hydrophobin [Trametes coccinea BRFM310]|uniref:Hydrophobin n=1 Tax=Trametes coccinea (strain BRFM310) TaxID=1353009 RepID=A0A1Y2J730_TRAC3|nr:fungal hydrophobin [Trametes coccinea BRFM310]
MFARPIALVYFVLSLAILAVAMPGGTTAPAPAPTGSTCSTGSLQCCNSVQSVSAASFASSSSHASMHPLTFGAQSDSNAITAILGLLGIVLGDITGLVGLGCSPISVVGVGSGNACSANAVCCENNNVGGLLSIGCLPIEL